MLRRWVELVIARPWVTISIILAISAGLASNILKMKIELEVDKQLPTNHPLVQIGQKIEKEFGGKNIVAIVVSPKKGTIYTHKVFRKLRAITDRANNLKGVRPNGVVSLVADNVRDIRSSAVGLETKPFVQDLPETDEQFAALRERLDHNKAMKRNLVNETGTSATISIDFNDLEAAGGAKNCQTSLEKMVAPERDTETDITVTGTPAMVHWFLVFTERANIVFFFALLMIGWLQYRTFRTFQGMLIPLVTAVLAVGWAIGMICLLGEPMDVWNGIIPILVLAVAAGHSTQILKRYYEEYNRIRDENPGMSPKQCNREAVVSATVKVGVVMLAAGGIAAVSFASLVTFDMPSIQTFGKGVAFGILASLIIEMSFIPALRSILPAPTATQSAKERARAFFDPLLYWLADIIRHSRDRWVIPAALAFLAFAAVGALRMEANNSLAAQFFGGRDLWQRFQSGFFPPSFLDGVREAEEKTAGADLLYVRVETKKADGLKDPDVLRRVERVQQFIQKRSAEYFIGNVVSMVDFIKTMNRVMHDDDPKAEVLPTTREAVAQYLFLASMSGPGGDIERYVDFDYQRGIIQIIMKTDDNQILTRLMKEIQSEINIAFKGSSAKAEIGGGNAYLVALNESIIHDKIKNIIQVVGIIFLVSIFLLRSLVGGLIVLIPILTTIIINFGTMGWCNIWLSMGTATISSIAAGIGADYAIYFIFRMREEFHRTGNKREAAAITLTTSGKAIMSVALAIGTGFLCMMASGNKIHFLMGILTALMMATSALAAVGLMPAVLVRIKAGFLSRGLPEATPPKPATATPATSPKRFSQNPGNGHEALLQ
jgi:predicted RND superfamily exporter protein